MGLPAWHLWKWRQSEKCPVQVQMLVGAAPELPLAWVHVYAHGQKINKQKPARAFYSTVFLPWLQIVTCNLFFQTIAKRVTSLGWWMVKLEIIFKHSMQHWVWWNQRHLVTVLLNHFVEFSSCSVEGLFGPRSTSFCVVPGDLVGQGLSYHKSFRGWQRDNSMPETSIPSEFFTKHLYFIPAF